MKKFLICLLTVLPLQAGATVIYSVQKTGTVSNAGETFAAQHRFYVGGMYDFSMWSNYSDGAFVAKGSESSGFDAVIGIRVSDIFRIEADYMQTQAKWDSFAIGTNSLFANVILDARLDAPYRFFYNQHLVPYVGLGGGLAWVDGVEVTTKKDTVAVAAALAGIGIEFDDFFTVDLGYRYVYMFASNVDVAPNLAPNGHQLRAGIRLNF